MTAATVLDAPKQETPESIIRRYLDLIDPESDYDGVDSDRIRALEERLEAANDPYDGIARLFARRDIEQEYAAPDALEAQFAEVLKPFAKKNGFDRAVFQQAGVEDRVLRKAGFSIPRKKVEDAD